MKEVFCVLHRGKI